MLTKKFKENQRFGHWVIKTPYLKGIVSKALCKCLLCGKEYLVSKSHLSMGNTTKCRSCYKKQQHENPSIKHGMHGTKVYNTWKAMRGRILNPQGRDKIHYKRIGLSETWNKFDNFYADMGNPPDNEKRYSIGRIDNRGDYCKENCRWETDVQQANNTSRTKWLTYKNKTMSMADWARELNKSYYVIRSRINSYGWSVKDALEK